MGYEKEKRPFLGQGGFVVPVQTVTLSSVAQTLSGEGVSFVTYPTSGKQNDAIIPAPSRRGQQFTVAVDNQTTSLEANFNTATTGSVFWGTTFNTITINSTVNDAPAFSLIAVSTSQWAVVNMTANISTAAASVDWALSATTGATV